MTDKIPQKQLEVKHSGNVVECGTLDVFLSFLAFTPVLVMPLQRTRPFNHHEVQQWCVHITARPLSSSPVYYCTFAAAEFIHLGASSQFTFPCHHICNAPQVATEQGEQWQRELLESLCTVLRHCPHVSSVVTPARYRMPNEWVWSARSSAEQLHFHEQHWTICKPSSGSL
jgi:hypothetical protein